ncbi:MAG: hypothetical protein WDM79_17460 [Terricaulis sp.]
MRALVVAVSMLLLQGCATLSPVALGAGDWVLAKWQPEDPYYYPAVVASRTGNDLTVQYDDGDSSVQSVTNVRRFDWRAGTHLECRFTDGNFYPAVITEMGANRVDMQIRYEDASREATDSSKCRDR